MNRPCPTCSFLRLAGPYWQGDTAFQAYALTAGLALASAGQVLLAIRLNIWSADLFNALERKSMDRFLTEVGIFALIVLGTVILNVAHLELKRRLQLDWRRWLTRRVADDWMRDGRQYRADFVPGDHGNVDGRIAEDIRNATESAIELGHSLLYCLLLLVSFIGILWGLSGDTALALDGWSLPIPGHMVWLALLYAGIGTAFAFGLGQPLVRATDKRQTTEADFRFGLVRARENVEVIAILRGEGEERRRFARLFKGIEWAWARQTDSLRKLMIFSSSYSTISAVFPILVSTPRYLAGAITLGALMQIAQAFQQVTSALSWPVDNFPRIAEMRASIERVLALTEAVAEAGDQSAGVTLARGPVDGIRFDRLSLSEPDGTLLLAALSETVNRGERVLVTGDPRAALALFKAVAGVWTWGRGRIDLPEDARIFFAPQKPYLPVATLREVMAYPLEGRAHSDDELKAVLDRVGLQALAGRLDESGHWDAMLGSADQQRLGFARLILAEPDWVFIEEATDAVDPEQEAGLMDLLRHVAPDATVLTVGHHPALEAYHQRKLVLARPQNGHQAAA